MNSKNMLMIFFLISNAAVMMPNRAIGARNCDVSFRATETHDTKGIDLPNIINPYSHTIIKSYWDPEIRQFVLIAQARTTGTPSYFLSGYLKKDYATVKGKIKILQVPFSEISGFHKVAMAFGLFKQRLLLLRVPGIGYHAFKVTENGNLKPYGYQNITGFLDQYDHLEVNSTGDLIGVKQGSPPPYVIHISRID